MIKSDLWNFEKKSFVLRKKEKKFKILSSIMMDNYVGDNVVFFVLCVCFENVKYVIW